MKLNRKESQKLPINNTSSFTHHSLCQLSWFMSVTSTSTSPHPSSSLEFTLTRLLSLTCSPLGLWQSPHCQSQWTILRPVLAKPQRPSHSRLPPPSWNVFSLAYRIHCFVQYRMWFSPFPTVPSFSGYYWGLFTHPYPLECSRLIPGTCFFLFYSLTRWTHSSVYPKDLHIYVFSLDIT